MSRWQTDVCTNALQKGVRNILTSKTERDGKPKMHMVAYALSYLVILDDLRFKQTHSPFVSLFSEKEQLVIFINTRWKTISPAFDVAASDWVLGISLASDWVLGISLSRLAIKRNVYS